tara:strand:- start:322 stop:522 length:201 start_codon:yes stop_codon:yes gene_type:complete
MIENYKGWDIALTWSENKLLNLESINKENYDQHKKWVGVDFMGHKIYGSSLKEIRHIIDYPGLYTK